MAIYDARNYAADKANVYGQNRPNVPTYNYANNRSTVQAGTPAADTSTPATAPASSYNPAWSANITPSGTPYLGKTIAPQTQIGLSPEERQRIYNQARLNFTGAMRQGVGEATGLMGGQGFVPGQSGRADTAIGQVYNKGLADLGTVMQGIATSEAQNRFNQGLALDQFKAAQNQWAQEFGANRQDQATTDLMNLMNIMQTGQSTVYAPYWDSLNAGINGGM